MRAMIVLSVAMLLGCTNEAVVEATEHPARLSPAHETGSTSVSNIPAETVIAAWNDTRPYVNMRIEIVKTEGGAFELRRGAIDGQESLEEQALTEVAVPAGRRFNLVEARNGDYYQLLEDGTALVGDNDGVLYTKNTLEE